MAINEKRKAVFVSDTSEWCHWGCNGTSNGMLGLIRAGYHLVGLISLEVITSLDIAENVVGEKLVTKDVDYNAMLNECDVVICNGEGTPHGSGILPKKLFALLNYAKHELNKQIIIANQSVYPDDYQIVNQGDSFERYKNSLTKYDYVAGREGYTIKQLQAMDVKAVQSFDCLPLFLRDGLGYTPSSPKNGPVLISGSSTWSEDIVEPIANVIKKLKQDRLDVLFIDGAKASATAKEKLFYIALKKYIPDLQYQFTSSLHEWIKLFDQSHAVLTGRYHHMIAAYATRTPLMVFDGITLRIPATCELLHLPVPAPPVKDTIESDLWKQYQTVRDGSQVQSRLSDQKWNKIIDLAYKNLPFEVDKLEAAAEMKNLARSSKRTWMDVLSDKREILRFNIKTPKESMSMIGKKLGVITK